MKETRTEYLARITAEHPGAYHRIDDLMRDWDHAREQERKGIEGNGLMAPATKEILLAELDRRAERSEARAWGEINVGSADPMAGEKFTLPKGKDNAAPEGGDAAPSEAPPKDVEQT